MAASNDVLCLESTLHVLEPLFVNCLEELGFSGHVLGDITACEDEHEVGPKSLNFEPLFNNVCNVREKGDLVGDFLFEGSDVFHCVHLVESSEIGFELLLEVHNVTT